MTAVSRVQAMLARDEHADAIAAFCRDTWGADATGESVLASWQRAAAENVVAPGEVPPIAIVLEGSRVIGYCASIPHQLWDGVAAHPAYWVKGLAVIPEYQRGPIGFLVWKTLAAQLTRAMIMVAEPPARRLFGAVGYADLGAVTNFVRPLRPSRIAQRLDVAALGVGVPRWLIAGVRLAQRTRLAGLAAAGAGLAADLAAAATRRAAARFTTGCTLQPPSHEELDDVWRGARAAIAASPVRDGRYLRWRFGADGAAAPLGPANDRNRYTFVTARDGARLVGVAVLLLPRAISDPRLRGVRVATISDIVFPPERAAVGLAVLGGVERAARAAGSDAILCTTSHRALVQLLRRQAYVPLPGNLHFFLSDTTGATHWPQDLASWWLTRGDGGADEAF